MAIAKLAKVVRAESLGPDTRLVELRAEEPLAFTGGQYVIVDTGLRLPGGKAVKRAYSLLGPDGAQPCFELAVKRIPGGPGSGFMHELREKSAVRFSGPWGRLCPPVDARGKTLVLATDTGVTAALGLVRSERFRTPGAKTLFVWLRVASEGFLPDAWVRERVPATCGAVRIEPLPPMGHPERVPHARGLLREIAARVALERAFLAGDGDVNYALLPDLVALGVAATKDNLESFFNMPKKSAPAAAEAS